VAERLKAAVCLRRLPVRCVGLTRYVSWHSAGGIRSRSVRARDVAYS